MKRILLTVSVLVLVLAACSGSDKDADSPDTSAPTTASTAAPSDTTTPGPTTSDTTPTNDAAADLATARAAVLQPDDLPGYAKTPDAGGGISEAAKRNFADCLGVESSFFDETPGAQKADSDDFELNGVEISSGARVHPTRATIDERFDQFSQPNVADCLGDLFASEMAARLGTDVSVDVNAQKFDVGIGDKSLGVALEILVADQSQETTLYGEYLLAARDRAGLTLTVFSEAGPVDRDMAVGLLQTMYDRVGDKAA